MSLTAAKPEVESRASVPRPSPSSVPDGEPAPAPEEAGIPLFLRRWPVQAKLIVGPADDEYEREADAVAQAVTSGRSRERAPGVDSDDLIQRKCSACEEEEEKEQLSGMASSGPIQRKCEACAAEEDEQEEATAPGILQRLSSGVAPSQIGGDLPKQGGRSMPGRARHRIEPVVGADLSDVRVHDDDASHRAAAHLKAKAFTHGNEIWLGAGQRSDDTELLAHEAAHVVQQGGGGVGPGWIQRAPADYRHPEDGGGVRTRMDQRIREDLEEEGVDEIPDLAADTRPGEEGSTGAPAGPTHAPRESDAGRRGESIDRAELAVKQGELQPDAEPSVDRPALERPKVEESAEATKETVEEPAEEESEESEEKEKEKESEGEEKKEGPLAEAAAAMAAAAFATAGTEPEPLPEPEVVPPPPVTPVDSAGRALPEDAAAEEGVVTLAEQAQVLREEGHRVRLQAREERRNAEVLRGNLGLVREAVGQSREYTAKSQDHLEFRRGLVGQASEALVMAKEKAATVAAGAPEYAAKSDEGKEDSGPMAEEASDLASENEARKPDDPEAAAKAEEQGGKMNRASSEIGTTDDAITQTKGKAESLGEEAAIATETNTATEERIGEMTGMLDETRSKLSAMQGQNEAAGARAEGLARGPAQMVEQAQALDQRGLGLMNISAEIEQRLALAQAAYEVGAKSVPPAEAAGGGAEGGDLLVQRDRLEGDVDGEVPVAALPVPMEGDGGAPPATPEGYSDRIDLNLVGDMPSWLTGGEEPSAEERERLLLEAEEPRRAELDRISELSDGKAFEELSATDKMGIALRLTGSRLFDSAGNIEFPSVGHLALGLIDPRGPLMGVVSGLSMTLSGAANLSSAEQWQREPLGNLLKSAADIATGLTIILGSITALAGVIIAIMAAITILTFGTAAPITGPVIAFCTTILTSVGGWTIAVGKVALLLQAFVFIKNLIEAACAERAKDLRLQSEQMGEDIANAGNVTLQIGMAKLATVGGREATAGIEAKGGGVRYAARMGAKPWASAAGGARGLAAEARAAGGGVRGAMRAGTAAAGRGVRAVGTGAREMGKAGWRGIKGFGRRLIGRGPKRAPAPAAPRPGFSRDFLVGKDIDSLASARSAARGARAEVWKGAGFGAGAARGGAPAKGEAEVPTSATDRDALADAAPKSGESLTAREVDTELDLVRRSESRPSSHPDYVDEIELSNGHTWRRTRDGRWCRFSKTPSLCRFDPFPANAGRVTPSEGKNLDDLLRAKGLKEPDVEALLSRARGSPGGVNAKALREFVDHATPAEVRRVLELLEATDQPFTRSLVDFLKGGSSIDDQLTALQSMLHRTSETSAAGSRFLAESEAELPDIGVTGKGFEGPHGDVVADPREAGNLFNEVNVPPEGHREVTILTPTGRRPRVDVYIPGEEIISRKFPMGQLAEDELKALDYVQEVYVKYRPGAEVRAAALRGSTLEGVMVLEIPVQHLPIPERVLAYARNRGIVIRDIAGRIYR